MDLKLEIREDNNYGEGGSHELFIGEKSIARVQNLCDCPEDATIYRDLINGNDIIEFIKLGYEAGKKGEQLKVEINTIEDKE